MAQVSAIQVLDGMEVSEREIADLIEGSVLAYSDKKYESTERELAADAIVIVEASLDKVREAIKDATTLIPEDVILAEAAILGEEDFAGIAYGLDEIDEVEGLFEAKPGSGDNLSEDEYRQLRAFLKPYENATDAEKVAAASDAMREILVNRYQAYRASGLDGVGKYTRGRKTVSVGEELKLSTETFRPFADDFPEFFRIMSEYPNGAECCENHFRWIKVRIRKRIAFALTHTMVQQTDDFVLFTERVYYTGNSLNSLQITLSWLPYGDGSYMGLAMAASADVLDSFAGRLLRPIGRNKAKDLVTDVMTDIREELDEAPE